MSEEKKLEEKIDERIEIKIDEILEQELGPGVDNVVKKKVEEKLREKISEEIDEKIKEKVEEGEARKIISPSEQAEEPVAPEQTRGFLQSLIEFKANFHLCWKGSCRVISLITLPAYIAIIILLVACHAGTRCGTANTSVSAVIFIALMLLIGISLFLSMFSRYPKTALIFWILLDIPLLILVLIYTAQFIALIIFALIILLRLIQTIRQEY